MATTATKETIQLYPDEFVESCGIIVLNVTSQQLCLVYQFTTKEYMFPKGRRNCSESRVNAAIREFREETGHTCNLVPLTFNTRAPPANEKGYTPDVPQRQVGLLDPFALTMRDGDKKLIWWYVGTLD